MVMIVIVIFIWYGTGEFDVARFTSGNALKLFDQFGGVVVFAVHQPNVLIFLTGCRLVWQGLEGLVR